jgi:hypothetical protein
MKKIQLILSIAISSVSLNSISQLTYMPDDAFEAIIETTYQFADNGVANDNYVLTAGLAGIFNVGFNATIQDFTGLESFPNLTKVAFDGSTLTSIDLSNIPINQNPSVFAHNLQIQNCPYLTTIIMPHNYLDFYLINCPYLTNIVFQNDNILYGGTYGPTVLSCNSLKTFDISNISDVLLSSELFLQFNSQLNCVNLKNGFCNKWAKVSFNGCYDLFCIEVDNPTFCLNAEAIDAWRWIDIMPNPSLCQYSTNCGCLAGIDEEIINEINISPNPTTSKINVKSSLELIGKEFIIYDQLGKAIKSGIITSEETEIDLSNLTEGIYLLKVGAEMNESFKIIKQ